MNKEQVAKLMSQKYGTPDNILGKELLLISEPDIKQYLVESGERYLLSLERVRELGYPVVDKDFLQFDFKDYPELWED